MNVLITKWTKIPLKAVVDVDINLGDNQSTGSLEYHLLVKHTADAEIFAPYCLTGGSHQKRPEKPKGRGFQIEGIFNNPFIHRFL